MLRRPAFSLIELVVVITILGLLASGGMLVLSGELRKAQRAGSLDSFVDLHQRACRSCQSVDVTSMFDFDKNTVSFSLPEGQRTLSIPALEQIVVDGAILDRGQTSITYSVGGPPTYAMILSSGKHRCLLVHAGTGLISQLDSEQIDAPQISTWQAAWANAD